MAKAFLPFSLVVTFLAGFILESSPQASSLPDSLFSGTDTVFLAPDTIINKNIVTIYVDEDDSTPVKNDKTIGKKQRAELVLGPSSGLCYSMMSPLYGITSIVPVYNINALVIKRHFSLGASIMYSGKESASLSYTRHYSRTNSTTDTITRLLDEYIQIIGTDTVRYQVTKKECVSRTDTLRTDSSFTHRNKYSYVSIPLSIGWVHRGQSLMLGIAIGMQCRFPVGSYPNRLVSGDSTWVNEMPHARKMLFDAQGQVYAKYRLAKQLWLTSSVHGAYPLSNHFIKSHAFLYRTAFSALLGLEYTFAL